MANARQPGGVLRLLLLATVAMVAPLTFTAANAQEINSTTASQPHIIFILADDLGFNDVSWHNPGVVMPNIDALAETGVRLEQSYVMPVCTPTRAALLTGRYPYTIGRQSSALKPMRPTGLTLNATLLPEVLREAGYSTHMVGKWHLGFCKLDYTPTYRGFDSFFGFYLGGQSYYTHIRKTVFKESKINKRENIRVEGYDFRLNTEPFYPQRQQYSTFAYASRARAIIAQHDPARPLFLYLPFQAVHGPLEAPDSYVQLYSGIRNNKRKTYLGMVTALDDAVGSVVKGLKEAGLYDNSVIVFTTDNGGGIKTGGNNWPLKGHKSTLFEGGVRGPAFVHSPLIKKPGTVHNGLIHVVDWYATLAGLAGGKVPAELDSMDQWQSINEGEQSPRSRIVYNIVAANKKGLKAAIRVNNYKLVIGETRGFTSVDPPEGESFRVSNENLAMFKDDEDRLEELRIMHEEDSSSIALNDTQQQAQWESFPLPNLSPMFEEYNFEEYVNDDIINCDNLTRKDCRKLNREISNLNGFQRVNDFFDKGLDMYLYNLADDPNETTDLSSRRTGKVRRLLRALLKELPRVVLADNPAKDPKANPDNFGGVWSSGWC